MVEIQILAKNLVSKDGSSELWSTLNFQVSSYKYSIQKAKPQYKLSHDG
jgi:hypothetical protein